MPDLADAGSWALTEGQALGAAQIYNSGDGVSAGARRRENNPVYRDSLMRALDLYEGVIGGNPYAALKFREAMTTSDFPLLFGDILDRQLYAKYQQIPVNWDRIAKRGTVRDFRNVSRYTIDGAESSLPEVDELTEYPAAALTEARYQYKVTKRGRRIPMSWETWLNGDLNQFQDLPTRLANAARRTEERFVTDLYAGASGPDSTFFTAGHANIVTANPALSVAALQTAFTVLSAQLDTDSEPIYIETVTLVVPPALEVVARNIINATEIIAAAGGGDGTGADQLRTVNWMRNKLEIVVNPYLPLISSTANGSTSWYLFANPNQGRPAAEIGFLIGHETPEVWMKSADAVRVGGGMVSAEEGSFDLDAMQWRVRHVIGGSLIDYRMAVASNGTGS
jgi:hypothetical protein